MIDTDLANEIDVMASWSYIFSVDDCLEPSINRAKLGDALNSDQRFICLTSEQSQDPYFITQSTLFEWFSLLNVRLASTKTYRLNAMHFATSLSQLNRHGRWIKPPVEVIDWGRQLGFIDTLTSSNEYVFPLAYALSFASFVTVTTPLNHINSILKDLSQCQFWMLSLQDMVRKTIEDGLSRFNPTIVDVIQARTGLITGEILTLDQIGIMRGCSRERIRQIENSFWRKIEKDTVAGYCLHPFIVAFLYDLIGSGGSLIVDMNSSQAPIRKFLARCSGIPFIEIPDLNILILAADARDYAIICMLMSHLEIDAEIIKEQFWSTSRMVLCQKDIQALSVAIVSYILKHLNKEKRIYLTLRKIGKPAHYLEITEMYNKLWPEHATTERRIHIGLEQLEKNKHGVVWIGVRGTFALQEWGYERPSKTLFASVTEIVEKWYSETGQPVPFNVIAAEIGKYRMIVKPTSLTIAAHCNPELQQVNGNSFVPKRDNDHQECSMSTDQLHQLLQEFKDEQSVTIDFDEEPVRNKRKRGRRGKSEAAEFDEEQLQADAAYAKLMDGQ